MEDYEYRPSNYRHESNPEPVSVKDWIVTLLLLMIPLVNIVLIFVWAFGSGTNPSKANYFKASLILFAIIMGLWFLFFFLIFGLSIVL